MARHLPDTISRAHIEQALQHFDQGQDHAFGPSTFYDLVWQGKRYPPKAIMGLAAELATGERWVPDDFTGGEQSRCFFLLRDRGFVISPKPGTEANPEAISADEGFGAIPGIVPGQVFANRRELSDAGIHRPLQAGIFGAAGVGARSIVLSGGYEDDEDLGNVVIYTGQGGQENGKQVADQVLTLGNAALARSSNTGLPVRVTRGAQHKSPFSPTSGYRYDGLYRVDSYWREKGAAGFSVYRFRLEKIENAIAAEIPADKPAVSAPAGSTESVRKTATVTRVVRDTAVSRWIKGYYKNRCQACGTAVAVMGGEYSEGAHIRALGMPHNGPDVVSNILCLCPNHHVMFDKGGFSISDDLSLIGLPGALIILPDHNINPDHLRYHREHFGFLDVVAAVAVFGDKYLVARRAPHKASPGKWEFPGGKIDAGETPQQALAREMEEEFGMAAEIGDLIVDTTVQVGPQNIRLRSYLVTLAGRPESSTDHDDIAWASVDELEKYDLCAPDLPTVAEIRRRSSL